MLPQLEALSILAVWCRGIGGTPFGSGPLQQITSEVALSFIAGEGPLNTRRARLPSDHCRTSSIRAVEGWGPNNCHIRARASASARCCASHSSTAVHSHIVASCALAQSGLAGATSNARAVNANVSLVSMGSPIRCAPGLGTAHRGRAGCDSRPTSAAHAETPCDHRRREGRSPDQGSWRPRLYTALKQS